VFRLFPDADSPAITAIQVKANVNRASIPATASQDSTPAGERKPITSATRMITSAGNETKSSVMTADAQFTIHRDNMIKAYDELLKMLTVLDRTDPEMKEKYRETASKIGLWPPEDYVPNRPYKDQSFIVEFTVEDI